MDQKAMTIEGPSMTFSPCHEMALSKTIRARSKWTARSRIVSMVCSCLSGLKVALDRRSFGSSEVWIGGPMYFPSLFMRIFGLSAFGSTDPDEEEDDEEDDEMGFGAFSW
jgi:hypothetical protein